MPRKKSTTSKSIQPKPKDFAAKAKKTVKKETFAKVFPIVGVGASAGGLKALKAFFAEVPEARL